MPTAYLIFNTGRIASIDVPLPPPPRYEWHEAGFFNSQVFARSIKEAVDMAKGERPTNQIVFYRVLGISSIAYVEDPQQSVAMVRTDA